MTTAAVEVAPSYGPFENNTKPSYSYQPAGPGRYMLASVKDGIYHPCLPTFRRMDMHNYSGKLPDEHCRTSAQRSSIAKDDYKSGYYSPMDINSNRYHGRNVTDTGRMLSRYYSNLDDLRNSRTGWSEFLSKCPERFNISKLPVLPSRDQNYTGYAVRYLRPDLTKTITQKFRQEPGLESSGPQTQLQQRPVPASALARHRDEPIPRFSRNVSAYDFRPAGKNYYKFV